MDASNSGGIDVRSVVLAVLEDSALPQSTLCHELHV